MKMYIESVEDNWRLFLIALRTSAIVSVLFTLKDLFFIIGASPRALNVTVTFVGAASVMPGKRNSNDYNEHIYYLNVWMDNQAGGML